MHTQHRNQCRVLCTVSPVAHKLNDRCCVATCVCVHVPCDGVRCCGWHSCFARCASGAHPLWCRPAWKGAQDAHTRVVSTVRGREGVPLSESVTLPRANTYWSAACAARASKNSTQQKRPLIRTAVTSPARQHMVGAEDQTQRVQRRLLGTVPPMFLVHARRWTHTICTAPKGDAPVCLKKSATSSSVMLCPRPAMPPT